MWRSCSGLARTRVCSKASASCVRRFGSEAQKVKWRVPLLDGSFSSDVKGLEAILTEKEREFGAESKEAGAALLDLGVTHLNLGDDSKARDALERALPIYEHEQGYERQLAKTLANLGNAHGGLGDHAKKRDMLERVVAIKEWGYGRDHPEVANTLFNLA